MAEDIETIRLLIGDRRKAAVNEIIGEGDGTNLNYQVDMFPLTSSPTASLSILSSGVLVAAANYNISGDVGRITFLSAPTAGNTILGNYEYHAFNSAELSDFLSGHTGDPYLAAANACLGLAGDTSKFFAYTLGEKAVDKRRISRDLRELAETLMDRRDKLISEGTYDAGIFSFKDNSGTIYHGYDAAEAVFTTTGS